MVSLFLNLRMCVGEAGFLLEGRAGKAHFRHVLVTDCGPVTPCSIINYPYQ